MKYKLKDVRFETEEDVVVGTCELCFSAPFNDTIHTYVFEDEEGTTYEIRDEYWSYGWRDTSGIEFENVCEFAMWLKDVDVQEPPNSDLPGGDYGWLSNLVLSFIEAKAFLEDVDNWDDEDWHLYDYDSSFNTTIDDMGLCDAHVINARYLEHSPAEAHRDGFVEGSYDKFVSSEDLDNFHVSYISWQEALKLYRDEEV